MVERTGTNYILLGAIVMNMLITICPFVDLYANWYITLIPIVVMMFYLQSDKSSFQSAIRILCTGLLLVLMQYWLINHRDEFSNVVINGIISWTPCIISLLCIKLVSPYYQKYILQIALIAMMVTSITTVQGIEIFPFASRELAGAATGEQRELYMSMNIGGFEFIYALVIALPAALWMISHTKKYLRLLNVFVLLSMIYCIYASQYTTALIITIVVLVLIPIYSKPQMRPAIIIGAIFFVFFAGTGIFSAIIRGISSVIESDYVADRLQQVALLLEGQSAQDIDTETSNERLVLMQQAWDVFFSSPIWGNNWLSWHKNVLSGHSFVLDVLSSSGALGLVIYVYLFYKVFKKIFVKGFQQMTYYSKIIWIAFIAVTIMNPSAFAIIYLVIFTFAEIINRLDYIENLNNNGR